MAILDTQQQRDEFFKKEPQPVLKTKIKNEVPEIPKLFDAATSAELSVVFIFDGKEYEVDQFSMSFGQSTNYKGQPQDEVRGGRIMITLSERLSQEIYNWAIAHEGKDVSLAFRTPQASSPLKMELINAFCVNFKQDIIQGSGVHITLFISPEELTINGINFYNRWA